MGGKLGMYSWGNKNSERLRNVKDVDINLRAINFLCHRVLGSGWQKLWDKCFLEIGMGTAMKTVKHLEDNKRIDNGTSDALLYKHE